MLNTQDKVTASYVIGVALGDGNLSNPNGRAVRLRITCDRKYPLLISKIERKVKELAPKNKVSKVFRKDNAVDISCYSNDWEKILGWNASGGSKMKQKVSIPDWILRNRSYSKSCLCGLIETDGSIFSDRGYLTVNFVTQIPSLAKDVKKIFKTTGYTPNVQKLQLNNKKVKFTFRIHKQAKNFIAEIGPEKR